MDIECRERVPVVRLLPVVRKLLSYCLGIGPSMSLKSLVLCADEKIVRVLRRVLGDLEIGVELCMDSDAALRKLTRQRFEAIIVDVTDDGASEVLRSARIRSLQQAGSGGCDCRADHRTEGGVRNRSALRVVQAGIERAGEVEFSGGASVDEE